MRAPRCACGNKTVPTIVKGLYLCQDHRQPELRAPKSGPFDPTIRYPGGMTPEECAEYRKQLRHEQASLAL